MYWHGSNGSILGPPTSFEAALDIALNADFSSFNRPEPADLSLAETGEEAELQAVEQHRTFDNASRTEAESTCDLIALYAGHAKLFKPNFRLYPEVWHGAGKRRIPVGIGRLDGEELGSVEPLGDINKHHLAPRSSVHSNTGREYKPGLLVAKASVKSFDKLWSILIDSGASGN